jgi:hypothetical protein
MFFSFGKRLRRKGGGKAAKGEEQGSWCGGFDR